MVECSDITKLVFGSVRDVRPAAFGDFNSDELTDVFVTRGGLAQHKTVEVLLAADEEPFLRGSDLKCNFSRPVTSVVPGDFDGDAFMDVLVVTADSLGSSDTYVHIVWGGVSPLNCSAASEPLLHMQGQPLAIDYDQDMIIDLFGVDQLGQRAFWIFSNSTKIPHKRPMTGIPNIPYIAENHQSSS